MCSIKLVLHVECCTSYHKDLYHHSILLLPFDALISSPGYVWSYKRTLVVVLQKQTMMGSEDRGGESVSVTEIKMLHNRSVKVP